MNATFRGTIAQVEDARERLLAKLKLGARTMSSRLEDWLRRYPCGRAETYASHLASAYLQGYRDGLEGKPFDMAVISLKERQHLLGYAFIEGWHDGNQERARRGAGGAPRAEMICCNR